MSTQEAPERLAYSLNEAAILLGVGPDLLRKHIRLGELEAVKLGRRTVITPAAMDKWLNDAPIATTA